jgi:hypothetical protein
VKGFKICVLYVKVLAFIYVSREMSERKKQATSWEGSLPRRHYTQHVLVQYTGFGTLEPRPWGHMWGQGGVVSY